MAKRIDIMQVGDSHFKRTSRWEECLRLHDEIAAECERRKPDLFIHTGDVYDAAPTPEEQNAVERWLTRIAAVCPVVIVRGNHDPVGALAIMRRLETRHPIVVEEACGVHLVAGVAVACVAWPRKAELVASLPPGATLEEVEQLALQALRNVFGGLGVELAKHDGPRVLAMHAMVRGSKTSSGQPLVGKEFEVGVEDLALTGAHYIALGHVHAFQDWTFSDIPVVFSGSPRRTAYGELEDKGFVHVAFEYSAPFARWGVAWDRVILPATRMFDVHETFGESAPGAGFTWLEGLTGTPENDEDLRGAEVRFRYDVASDQRAIAKAWVKDVEAHYYDRGAADVKIEEEVVPVVRARAPEIEAAQTTEDQLLAYWKATNVDVYDRRERLLAKLAQIVGPVTQGATSRGALCYTSIRHSGFGKAAPIDIDLETIPGPLVALVGPNGIGKTTTAELLYGAVYREMLTRGTLGSLASSRNAQLEVGVRASDGNAYLIRHTVDGQTGVGTVLLTDAATGRPVLPDVQVSKFDKWVERTLAPKSVVAASMFSAQGTTGLLGMKEGERKAVILRILGVEALEGYAKTAREKARDARVASELAAGRLADEHARAVPLATAKRNLEAAEEALARATKRAEHATQQLEQAKAAEDLHREQSRALSAWEQGRAGAVSALDGAKRKLADLETRTAADRAIVAQGETIRAATANLAALEERTATLRADIAKAKTDAEIAAADAERATKALQDARKRYADLDARRQRIEERLREKASVEAAASDAFALLPRIATAEKAVADATTEVERLGGLALVGAAERIVGLRNGLSRIAASSEGDDLPVLAGATLDADTLAETNAKTVPRLLALAKTAAAEASLALRQVTGERTAALQKAARLPDFQTLDAELVQVRGELDVLKSAGLEAKTAEATAQAALVERRGFAGGLEAALAPLAAERSRLAPLARSGELAAATARVEALGPELAAAAAEVDRATAALGAIDAGGPPPIAAFDPRTLTDATSMLKTAGDDVRSAEAQIAQHRATLATAIASDARQAELLAEKGAHESDLSDWTLLGHSLGRDGVQALIIDAAGPRVTTLVNDLLHKCHGPRFTLRVDCAPLSADGKKQLDGCEIMVLDTKPKPPNAPDFWTDGEREGHTFSGGERGLLNEALSLAFTMLVCQRSGLQSPTLVRDETGAAFDQENGRAYIAMLRRAAEFTGASRVIFISHDPVLVALADGRIDLGLPQVATSVVSAPVSATAEAPKKRRTRKAAA
jgi:DNA repair exonuclease SbcCD ATPase subunit/DNA repair exonuclease SbcCD nuclease subunit